MFLGEVNSGLSSMQVLVKELQASASVQEQMHFLEEAQPYRWVASGHRGAVGVAPGSSVMVCPRPVHLPPPGPCARQGGSLLAPAGP